MTGPELILASASPRRRELIARLGIVPSTIAAADIDESPHKAEVPRDYAARMAREKAVAVSGGEAHVLAGDTVETLSARILDEEHAAYVEAVRELLRQKHDR